MSDFKPITSYDRLTDVSPLVSQILTKEMADTMWGTNRFTTANLGPTWKKNFRRNLMLFEKHGSIREHFSWFGVNKAVIGIGAGPSFNRNKDVLLRLYQYNLQFSLDDQPFIFVAANKMLKPLIKMGVRPHFTLLVDAGDQLYPQLCEGIPKSARDSFLIAGMHTSPKILRKWDKRGGHILFYMIGEDDERREFEQQTKRDASTVYLDQGGNVLNTLWLVATQIFQSSVYMTVGNDLAFKYTADKAERERSFYADGDYALNIANKRDEAKDRFGWMGFNIYESTITPGRLMFDLEPVGISRQLWIYKTWMEVQATLWAEQTRFIIYNASEAGTLGVLARDLNAEAMYRRDNWYLIDELLPKRWRTTTLRSAANEFLEARCQILEATSIDANVAAFSPARTGIVKPTDLRASSSNVFETTT